MIFKNSRSQPQNLEADFHSTSTTSKGLSENSKKMSWVNPILPIDTENSISFIVQFFWGQARLVGESVKDNSTPDFSTPSFNPGLFNQKLSSPGLSNPILFNYGTFLQQLECGYEFPALIHVWIASASVLEWFISTSLIDGLLDDFYESGKEFPALNRY